MAFPATYLDGRTAQGRPATVSLEARRLIIELDEGTRLAWPADDVRDADPPEAARTGIRVCRVGTDERLSLTDPAAAREIRAFCPNLTGRRGEGHGIKRPLLLWGGAAVVSVVLLFWIFLPALGDALARAIPRETVHQMGTVMVPRIARMVGAERDGNTLICGLNSDHAALGALVDRLHPSPLDDGGVPLTVWVVDSPVVNAMALPGGHVLVFSGLLGFVESGDELAGILAHEIGHVMLRHPIRITVERATVSAFFGLFFGDITGGTMLAGVASTLLGNTYSRDMEREADQIGVDLMRRAELDPNAVAPFFERLKARDGARGDIPAFLSTHPAHDERISALGPAPERVRPVDPAQWQAIRGMCGG